jgi:hypothetical protein
MNELKQLKVDILQKAISAMCRNEPIEMHIEQMRNLLLKDTNGTCKLYKYRSFDKKKNNLKSIESGILWCSPPSEFNDPFDSKMGFSIQEITDFAYKTDVSLLQNIFDVAKQIFNGELDINKCDALIKPTVEKLLMNTNIKQMLENIKKSNDDDDKVLLLKQTLLNNYLLPIEILNIAVESDGFSQQFKTNIKMFLSSLVKTDKSVLLKLYEESSTLESFATSLGINADCDELDLTVLLGEKMSFDKDAIKEFSEKVDNFKSVLHKLINDMYYIGCLATDNKNRLMWSHYAVNHTGFCIEYDFSDCYNPPLYPICYTDTMPQIPWDCMQEPEKERNIVLVERIINGFLTKDIAWEYENEWRILTPQANKTQAYQMPQISCIYLGMAISQENRKEIIKIAKAKGIPVKQMVLDSAKYELHAKQIDY